MSLVNVSKWGVCLVVVRKPLLADLRKQVTPLEKDPREQVAAVPAVGSALRAEYDRAFALKRTASTWAMWRDERVTPGGGGLGTGYRLRPVL